MNLYTRFYLRISLFFCMLSPVAQYLHAQELNCNVQVLSSMIPGDKKIYETLQKSIAEFLNNRKWTNDIFLNQERIECSMVINIKQRVSTDEFTASIQVQARRPIYKTAYNSTLLNFNDENFNFKYVEYQPLEFNEQAYLSNLTSVLAFYAYTILGLDYDSFSLDTGTPYYQKALAVLNYAQNNGEKGWKATDGTRTRYWLIENLLNPVYEPIRQTLYNYHRKGLDVMPENAEQGRKEITASLENLKKVHTEKPGSFLMQVFFNAKADEVVNVYSQAMPGDKNKIATLLNEIDPGNSNKYQNIPADRDR